MLRLEEWTLSGMEFIVGNVIWVMEPLFECVKFHYYNSKRPFFIYSLSITLRILLRQPKVLFNFVLIFLFFFSTNPRKANPRCESHVILRDSRRGGWCKGWWAGITWGCASGQGTLSFYKKEKSTYYAHCPENGVTGGLYSRGVYNQNKKSIVKQATCSSGRSI